MTDVILCLSVLSFSSQFTKLNTETKQILQKRISAQFCVLCTVYCIPDLQFGCTGPDRHFCTLAYTQPQPPFRQRFPLCFPESVCRKSIAVDLGRGPYTERVTQAMGELVLGKGKKKYMYSWHRGSSENKRTANSWFSYQSEVVMIIVTRSLLWLTWACRSHSTSSGLLKAVKTIPAIGTTKAPPFCLSMQ